MKKKCEICKQPLAKAHYEIFTLDLNYLYYCSSCYVNLSDEDKKKFFSFETKKL